MLYALFLGQRTPAYEEVEVSRLHAFRALLDDDLQSAERMTLAMNRRFCLPMFLIVVLGSLIGCGVSPLVSDDGNQGSSNLGSADGSGSEETPQPSNEALPDSSLTDVNADSARFREVVSPRDYLGRVSAWYFGHST
jgi:hypothetical protein